MVLTRASVVVSLLLVAACDQSLFDSNVSTPDAAVPAADGAVSLCPEPCLGDAYTEFSASAQGGSSGHWRYRADQRADSGAVYADLAKGTVAGRPGWISDGTPTAGITTCSEAAGVAACAGLNDYLLLVPSALGDGKRDPVLAYVVPQTGVYRLTGQYRLPDGGTAGVKQDLVLSRNSRFDYQFLETYTPSLTPGSFDVEVVAAKGDLLMLTSSPRAAGAASALGVRFFASRADTLAPADCAYTGTFDDPDSTEALLDRCTTMAWKSTGADPIASVSPELGDARRLDMGDFLVGAGGPIDRRGDFTFQFWFKDSEPDPSELPRFEMIYGDMDCAKQGGMWVNVRDSDDTTGGKWDITWMYHVDFPTWCDTGEPERLQWDLPLDYDNWHFFRFVRSTEDEKLRVCVDGVQVATTAVAGDLDLTGGDPPFLGKNNNLGGGEPGDTTGAIDDFRAFSTALPCAASPL